MQDRKNLDLMNEMDVIYAGGFVFFIVNSRFCQHALREEFL
jgi:hypothetical protein